MKEHITHLFEGGGTKHPADILKYFRLLKICSVEILWEGMVGRLSLWGVTSKCSSKDVFSYISMLCFWLCSVPVCLILLFSSLVLERGPELIPWVLWISVYKDNLLPLLNKKHSPLLPESAHFSREAGSLHFLVKSLDLWM